MGDLDQPGQVTLPDPNGGETSIVRVMTASGVILVVRLQTFANLQTVAEFPGESVEM